MKYSIENKKQAIEQVEQQGYQQTAKSLGIPVGTLRAWAKKQTGGENRNGDFKDHVRRLVKGFVQESVEQLFAESLR